MDDLNNLLITNNCDTTEFTKLAHQTLLLFILEAICRKMKTDPQCKKYVLSEYYRTRNNSDATQKIAYKFCGVKLPSGDLVWLNNCILAHLKKREKRKMIPSQLKENLISEQNFMCAYCKEPITLDNSHCDHIVPWEFVGDELKDNYQMLCTYCNEHKNATIYYALKRQIIKNNL